LPPVLDLSDVEAVAKHQGNCILPKEGQCPLAPPPGPVSGFVEDAGHVRIGVLAGRVLLKGQPDAGRFPFIRYGDTVPAVLFEGYPIAEGDLSHPYPPPGPLFQPFGHFRAQVVQVPLCKGGQHCEDYPPGGVGEVKRFAGRYQGNAQPLQFPQKEKDVYNGPAEAVQFVNNDDVKAARLGILQHLPEGGAFGGLCADAGVGVDGGHFPAPFLGQPFAGGSLGIQTVAVYLKFGG
jgi:hypothetical protein